MLGVGPRIKFNQRAWPKSASKSLASGLKNLWPSPHPCKFENKVAHSLRTIGFWHGPWVRKICENAVNVELCAQRFVLDAFKVPFLPGFRVSKHENTFTSGRCLTFRMRIVQAASFFQKNRLVLGVLNRKRTQEQR